MSPFAISFLLLIQSPSLGKTDAEILAMGLDGWVRYAEARSGGSTAAMSGTYAAYADAAGRRNDRLISKLAPTKRRLWKGLQADMRTYMTRVIETGPYLTGGGTMWIWRTGQMDAATEDAFYNALSGKGQKPPTMRVSAAAKALDALEAKVRQGQDWEFMPEFRKPEALRSLTDARLAFARIVGFAAKQDRRTSDVLLDFCRDQAQSVASSS